MENADLALQNMDAMLAGIQYGALAIALLLVVSMWKLFVKAGRPGWAAIIPIYNLIVMLRIAGKSAWWILLFMIPLVNIIFIIMFHIALAKAYGKGALFGLGLIFLSPIFFPVLAFGDAQYQPARAE